MKAKLLQICVPAILIIAVVLLIGGCKDFGVPDYELKILVGEGVQGTPLTGTYTHQELTIVEYNYEAINSDHTVEVLINGLRLNSSAGTLTLFTNTELEVRVLDIRGAWNYQLTIDDSTDEPMEFVITFTGNNLLSGSFTDDRGYRGSWNVTGTEITITYANWNDYILTGSIASMSGAWVGAGETGTWTAGRVTDE